MPDSHYDVFISYASPDLASAEAAHERLSDVRYQANLYFVGRERELNESHEGLHQYPTNVF